MVHTDPVQKGTAYFGATVTLAGEDGGDAEQRRCAKKQTGDEPDVTAKGDFGVGVESAGERDTAAGEREASHEQNHGQRASDELFARLRAHFDEAQIVDAIARADYDQPEGRERARAHFSVDASAGW